MLGWLSVANALVLCALIVALPTIVVARSAVAPPGSGSIGAAAGGGVCHTRDHRNGLRAWLAVAMAGALRKERPGWVHGLGVSLNLGAPGIALVILRALYH